VGKAQGKRPFLRPRRRWKDIIKIDIEMRCDSIDWIRLAQY